ncbi:MAG: sugar ABC transporter ATP-binding protein [Bacillota bacterium]|nr:sugar ABC transporter ATP-binding protein [Bacillota bacterium]
MSQNENVSKPYLRLKNISKTFPGVKALQNIDFDVRLGEVHALIGENGAGKSTLIKILAGVYKPDAGGILEVDGVEYPSLTTKESMHHGIIAIYQDFSLFPTLSVKENIAFSEQMDSKGWLMNWREVEKTARQALDNLGVKGDLNIRANMLSTAKQQLVAIARALVYDAKILIMDEPTSALSSGEVDALFQIVNKLRDQGMGIIFISHKLDELFRISDRMTVLRDGLKIATAPKSEMTRKKLISLMVGREVSDERMLGEGGSDVVLEVKNICKKGNFEDVSFTLKKGEILGITGLVGAGRTETIQALFGLNEPDSGEIWLEGKKISPKSPAEAEKLGIAFVPESRQTEGLILQQNVENNITLPILEKFANKLMRIDFKKRRTRAEELIKQLDVRPNYPHMETSKLSGGNQQKIVIAKWLATNPKILIVDEPTNGIDVGAKTEIHKLLRSLADQGMAVIMVSSELPEILAVSDRVLVMRQGRVSAIVDGADADQELLMSHSVQGGLHGHDKKGQEAHHE